MTSEKRKGIRFIPILLLGMGLAWVMSVSPLADFLGRAGYDHLLGLTRSPQDTSRTAVIAVDDAALARFPEPIALWHPHWAVVLNGITQAGIRGVAMDMVFAVSLKDIAPDLDRQFIAALKAAKTRKIPVYLGVATGDYAQMPHPAYAVFSSGLGFLNLSADTDEVVRRQTLFLSNPAGKRLMSLSRILTDPALSSEIARESIIYIDYRFSPPPVYSFSEIHQWASEGRMDRLSEALDGKFLVLGFESPILQDLHPIPEPTAPSGRHMESGLMIHARIAQTLLAGNPMKDAPPVWTATLCILLGIGSATAFFRWPPLIAIAVMAGFLLAAGFGLYQAFRSGIVLPAGSLFTFTVFPGLAAGLYQWVSEYRQRRVLQHFFGKYVHPQVVEDILKAPDRIVFGGEAVRLTVMFTDIRDFTRICEPRDPGEILTGLNRYFESMNTAIGAAGGYLNRTLGDGILALFGAPMALPEDGAWAAVRCGLDMLDRLESLNRESLFPGAGPIRIGIGIHTGTAIVGNVGSQSKMEYSIVGDTANLAARIETLTKTYKVPLLISGETLSRVADRVRTRYLDTTTVPGRNQQVSVYAVEGLGEIGKETR